jgi:O-acetyl-ADP-ribose deacetylase (regulator of RNase III)
MEKIRLILVDPDPAVCAAFSAHFGGLPGVEINNGCFEDLMAFDCIVSAANSFGFMSGGMDAAIVRFFGDSLQERVQARLAEEYLGEQPVGTSLIIETGNPKHPYIAHTPTMRVPMPVALTDNAYVAMWATLLAIRAFNRRPDLESKIRLVACPGLCTATGRMPSDEAARQMALAYRFFLYPPRRADWNTAFDRQDLIGRGGDFPLLPPNGAISRKKE